MLDTYKLAATIQTTKTHTPEPVVNVFIELFGRDYRIEDHFQICWWYFMTEKAGHRDALDILDNMYNEKKHRVWGPLFGKTDHLIELPQYIGDPYNKHSMGKFTETVAHLGDRMFEPLDLSDLDALIKTGEGKPKDERLTQQLLKSFTQDEVQRINYYSSPYHLAVRYAGAGKLTPTVRSYCDFTVYPVISQDRPVVDVAVQQVIAGEEGMARFPDMAGHVAGINIWCDGEINHSRLTRLPNALFINEQFQNALKNEMQGLPREDIFVTAERVEAKDVEAMYITHTFQIEHDAKGHALLTSTRSHNKEDGTDVPRYCKVGLPISAMGLPDDSVLPHARLNKTIPFYTLADRNGLLFSKSFRSLHDLEASIFLAKMADNITLHYF